MKKHKEGKNSLLKTQPVLVSKELSAERNNSYMDCLGASIIILLGIGIYSNSFDCSFHFDDKSSIVENMLIRNLSDLKSIWSISPSRFVSYYSLALNYHFGELNVWGYHLVNLILHILSSMLVYWLTLLIFSTPAMKGSALENNKKLIALFVALLFLSNPLATQSVTYIVQRMASLVSMFYLLSVSLYIRARLLVGNKGLQNFVFITALLAGILAFFTKENSFSLPLAILLVEIFFLKTQGSSINWRNRKYLLFGASFLGMLLLVLSRFSFSVFKTLPPDSHTDYRAISALDYLYTQFAVIIKYISLLAIHQSLNLDYDFSLANGFFELRTVASFLILLSLFILALFLYNKDRIVSFGIFWFFLTLSIESSIKPISDLIFEHRTYLPSFGFFLILSTVIYRLFWRIGSLFFIVIVVFMIGARSWISFERNKVWKDELTLWSDVVSKSPNKARGYFNLALQTAKTNNTQKALEYYSKVIELQPMHDEALNNRGLLLASEKRNAEALADFNKMIELYPNSSIAYNARGSFFINEKRFEEAFQDIEKSLKILPGWEAFNNKGLIFLEQKNYEEAIVSFKKGIELNANNAMAYFSLGILNESINNAAEAFKMYSKAISINPNYTDALFRAGNLFSKDGKYAEALKLYDQVLGIDPKYMDVYNNKGNVYVALDKYPEALVEFNKAIELNPVVADSYNNRGTVFMGQKQYYKAIEDFNKALEMNSAFAMAFANRGICYLNSGQKIKGCADLERAIGLGFQPAKEIFSKNCQ